LKATPNLFMLIIICNHSIIVTTIIFGTQKWIILLWTKILHFMNVSK